MGDVFVLGSRAPPSCTRGYTLLPHTPLLRSASCARRKDLGGAGGRRVGQEADMLCGGCVQPPAAAGLISPEGGLSGSPASGRSRRGPRGLALDRKSTRLKFSH